MTATPKEGLLPSICGKQEGHLQHVRNLRLRVADISLNKTGQDSLDGCSDSPTFDDLIEVVGWGSSRAPNRL